MKTRDVLARTLVTVVLLFATGGFTYSRTHFERIPTTKALAEFPVDLLSWHARDLAIDQKVREVLGKGEFLSRNYASAGEAPIDLFIGYYASQRSGSTPHSPQNCLPGSGWEFSDSKSIVIPTTEGGTLRTREYVISKGTERALVYYWYQAHGRAMTSEYKAKFYLFADAIRLNRTDGAIVRVLTPISPREDIPSARKRLSSFVGEMVPHLNRFIPN